MDSLITKQKRLSVPLAAIFLLVICCVASSNRAIASCGDYLMPLGSHDEVGHSDKPAASEGVTPLWQLATPHRAERSAPPCDGPNCGQAPVDATAMTVASPPERQVVNILGLEFGEAGYGDCGEQRFFSREPSFTEQSALSGILRPPRA